VLRPEEHDARPDSCGRPCLFVRVVDEDGDNATLGELLFTDDGWFRSGDLVRIDEEGYLLVADRIKDVINTGGLLVASREVEEALPEHPAVSEIAVIGLPDDRWIEPSPPSSSSRTPSTRPS
jgi:fatty-acyl-CoA synthase